MKFTWIQKEVLTVLTPANVYEHTPLNPWRGQYPRFIRPPRDENRVEWVKLYEDGRTARPGELPRNDDRQGPDRQLEGK